MTTDWDRLAGAIRERRKVLDMTQQQLADAAGVDRSTIKNLEGARTPKRLPSSIAAVEQALGWTSGSAQTVLAGGEPTIVIPPTGEYPPAQDPFQPLADRLPVSVLDELSTGEVYAADIHDLTVDGGMRIITVAVRHPEEPGRQVTPERRRHNHRAWSRMQRQISGLEPLPYEPGDPEEWKDDDAS